MHILKELIANSDAFGWVPTIRGSLSLDLLSDARRILGDVDKYAVEFKYFKGHRSLHYIAATSLLTVNDRKAGSEYLKTLRYFFTATINDEQQALDMLEAKGLGYMKSSYCKYTRNNAPLVGKLSIVVEKDHFIPANEADFLVKIKSLASEKNDYLRMRDVKAESMSELAIGRNKMLCTWREIRQIHERIMQSPHNSDDAPTYCFDVFLTRDGIMLLDNRTADSSISTIAAPGSEDDYKIHKPIHRLFKVAMNYVKFLFHYNYHHNEEHDTYLPASNLHSLCWSARYPFTPVFRHQLESFLAPITRLKRDRFKDYVLEPNGILLYAKAFINVCRSNGLVEPAMLDREMEFVEIQSKEIEQFTSGRRTRVNAAIVQKLPTVLTAGILAIVVAILKIVSIVNEAVIRNWDYYLYSKPVESCCVAVTVAVIISAPYMWLFYGDAKNQFRPRDVGRWKRILWFRNSRIDKRVLSKVYVFYNKAVDVRLRLSEYVSESMSGLSKFLAEVYYLLLKLIALFAGLVLIYILMRFIVSA